MLEVLRVISRKEFKELSKDNEITIIGFSNLERYEKKHEKTKKIRKMKYINEKE